MNTSSLFPKLKRLLKRASSLLMLFQRTPAAQILLPAEFNLAATTAVLQPVQLAVATVVGLGAYDSVAGATTISLIAGSLNGAVGTPFSATFQVTGTESAPNSWRVSPTTPLHAGLDLPNVTGEFNAITGTPTESGTRVVSVQAWEGDSFTGNSVQKNFTISITAGEASIITSPANVTINSGQTTTLTVVAAGSGTLTYQWFQGISGDTSTPVGTNSANFTTPVLTATTGYWVRVTNASNPTGANSTTAVVTVRQPAAIATHPVSIEINTGQTTTLSVIASGTAPFTYQWYQGTSGVITTPVGTNSPSFTTPTLFATTSYWVKVTNAANTTGANSNTADVTVTEPTDPTIFTPSPLPTARTNVAYSTTLTAFGGRQPYTWTIINGDLPDGFTMTQEGVISGTSGGTGTATFTVEVTDQDSKTDARAYELLLSDLDIATTALPSAVKGVAYSAALLASGGAEPFTWSLQSGALPAGITLSSAGVLSGTPTVAGDTAIVVRVTDSATAVVTKALLLPVSATFIKPVVDPITFPVVTVGSAFSHTVTAQNYPKTFTITGLPKGLKAAANGVITGNPEVSGLFNVQVKATNSAGSSKVITTKLTVKPLPKNLVGTFGGIIARHNGTNRNLGGQFNLTVTSNGAWTFKITGPLPNTALAKGATAISSVVSNTTNRLSVASPSIVTTVAGAAVSLNIDSLTGNVSGTVGGAAVNGWRTVWNATTNPAEAFAGYYSMALDLADSGDDGVASIPQGSGYATFTIGLGGSFSIVGKTADGEVITTSTFLSETGDFWVFSPIYKGAGTLHGSQLLTADPQSEFIGNTISGSLTWLKPTTATRAYAPGFGPINLSVHGGYLAPASSGNVVLGLPDEGDVQLSFTDGGLASSATDPDITFTYTSDNKVVLPQPIANPAKVALTINANTGAVAGNFTLTETAPPLTRAKVPFQGQVVRFADGQVKAVGYFMLPQIPSGGQTAAAAPMLSGGFSLLQQVP